MSDDDVSKHETAVILMTCIQDSIQRSVSNVGSFTLRITLSPARRKFRRRLIIQRGVRAALVIILTPFTDGFPGMTDVIEPVFIQAFIGFVE